MNQTLTKDKKQVLLTKEEEKTLVTKAQAGSKKALRILVEHNQGLVHNITHRFPLKNNQCTYDDLYQVGMMGFIHAVEMFEVDKGFRLSTYSYRWIHSFIRRYFQNNGRVVRIPAHLADRKYQLDRKVQNLTHTLGRVPSPEEIESLVPGYSSLVNTFSAPVSLNKELDSGEEVMDLQKDSTETEDVDTVLHVNSLLDLLKNRVSDRDYNIFITRYGVDNQVEHTLNEVAEIYGVTRARCHQITTHCLKLIREIAD